MCEQPHPPPQPHRRASHAAPAQAHRRHGVEHGCIAAVWLRVILLPRCLTSPRCGALSFPHIRLRLKRRWNPHLPPHPCPPTRRRTRLGSPEHDLPLNWAPFPRLFPRHVPFNHLPEAGELAGPAHSASHVHAEVFEAGTASHTNAPVSGYSCRDRVRCEALNGGVHPWLHVIVVFVVNLALIPVVDIPEVGARCTILIRVRLSSIGQAFDLAYDTLREHGNQPRHGSPQVCPGKEIPGWLGRRLARVWCGSTFIDILRGMPG